MKKQILLKIPENLKIQLQKEAKEKGLSLNGYITNLLWNVIEKEKSHKESDNNANI
jgi:hypothetical protein